MACTVKAWWAPYRVPVGMLTLAFLTASPTSSMPRPRLARPLGSNWMRTAYFCDPKTWTWATPFTMEMRCAMRVSPYSSTVDRGRVSEVRAR